MLITKDTRLIYRNVLGREVTFSSFSSYIPERVEEDVSNAIHTMKTSLLHGENYVASSLESRYITIDGFLEINTSTLALKDRLLETINPTMKGKLIHTNAAEEREIDCIAEGIPQITSDNGMVRFTVNLRACNPFWKNREKVEELTLLTPKLVFPLAIPKGRGMIFGAKRSTLETEVDNIGDAESGFRVIFKARGTVKNPNIYNKLTGERIKLNYTMVKGEVIEVVNYPEQKKVTVNGTVNGFRYLDIVTDFFNLAIGKNVIGYGAEENVINLDIILYYTPRYLGV